MVKNLSEIAEFESGIGKNLPNNQINKITTLYQRALNIPTKKPARQFIVCPVGKVGAGKTTVIKPLSRRLSLLRISTDEIRKILHKNNYNYIRTKEIAINLLKKYIKQGHSIAVDADCVSRETQTLIEKHIKKLNIKIFWIHINPPEKFIINKLSNYKHTWLFKDADDAIANYLRRKPLHKNFKLPFIYVFDTSKPDLKEQINKAVSLIKKELKYAI